MLMRDNTMGGIFDNILTAAQQIKQTQDLFKSPQNRTPAVTQPQVVTVQAPAPATILGMSPLMLGGLAAGSLSLFLLLSKKRRR